MLTTEDVRVLEGADGHLYARLDDLIVGIEEFAESVREANHVTGPLTAMRLIANSLRDLRQHG